MGKGDDVAEEESVDLAWRVELLRALITGDLPNVERVILSHIETMSAPFTAAMPSWTLQWEGMHWWMLQNATPLFVASAYSRPDIVHWLLLNGADRSTPCYLKQTPVQIVGECCAHAALCDKSRDSKAVVADSARCIRLLEDPPALPSPPTNEVAFSSSYSAEVVITPTGSSQTNSIQQTAYKCLLRVSWQTSLSNGAMIGKYELRYRRLVTEDGSEASSDQEDDKKRPAVDSTTVTWHSERVAHNRKSRQQSALIEGLQFNTVYEFMLRSWNAAGKGEWSPSFQTKTPAVPTRSAGAR
ncbi:hypothetical protein PC129_g15147 [Phytophthora cactorum]|uniref:Fibronectin type-III domain-containing protein n=1 Tax=Phytophthora cactorum TaxID=29920 RepID=A0A329RIT2_9STRA|nr:hypothetical protein Pcac1_g2821 [Phytophthora cactorum]KAG2807414.1 hypothetical protein PC112_g17410 [Phytophthora cactorum]KAG2809232.1 hypothetical protein PC111_g16138 [Phytophthora cactorum]KAG2848991.1 hypothetical protein PC113_g17468 [Phytophthora cactorum]KAG2892925.1 hypothetical protein PC114_g16447 [Phytophthora cactorum]